MGNSKGVRQKARVLRDSAIIFLVAVLAFVSASVFNLFEAISEWSQKYERWQIDELIIVLIILSLAFGIFSLYRSRREISERRRTEAALRESEERFKTLFENAPVGIYRTTPDGRVLMANPTLVNMLGYPSFDELAKRNLEKGGFEPAYPRKQFKETLDQEGEIKVFETAWMRHDGSMIFVRENARAIRGRDGTVLYYEGTVEDITERKKMLDALKRSEQDYRGLFEYAHDAIIIFDPRDETVLEVNRRACEIYGFSRAEFIGMSLETISRDASSGKARITETLKKGDYLNFETVQYRKDGSEIFLEINATVVDYKGQLAILSINRDITDRRRAEEALRESEDRYRDLVENSQDLICTHDPEGRLLSVNLGAARLLGYEPSALLKKNIRDLLAPEARDKFEAFLDRLRREGSAEGLMVVQTTAGERRILQYRSTLRTEGVAAPVVRGMAHDVTELKRAEEALRESENKYRMLMEQASDAIFISNQEGYRIEANFKGCELLGYTHEELLQLGAEDVFIAEDPAIDPLPFDELRAGRTVLEERRLRHKDGTPIPVEISSKILEDGRLLSIAREIAERDQVNRI